MYSEDRNPDLASSVGVLTIEIDPQQLASIGGRVPDPVDRQTALRLGEAVAADLEALVGDVKRFGLVIPGAVYDQTNVLRPGFPIAEALEAVFRGTLRGRGYEPKLIALGREAGETFPIEALNPESRPGAGPLLLIPFAFVGPVDLLSPLTTRMEQVLLHEGKTSAATREVVQSSFGLRAVHISYATLADLCALLSVQLEQNGFEPLWVLLEHGFLNRHGPVSINLPEGNLFIADGRNVWSPFFTLDQWSSRGPQGEEIRDPVESYMAWTKLQRQYSMALEAYGYTLHLVSSVASTMEKGADACLAALRSGAPLTGEWHCETPGVGRYSSRASALVITHHSDADIGTFAYTVETLDLNGDTVSTEHFYPLVPAGLQSIIEIIEQRGEVEGLPRKIVNPDGVLYDAITGRLRGDHSASTTGPTRH